MNVLKQGACPTRVPTVTQVTPNPRKRMNQKQSHHLKSRLFVWEVSLQRQPNHQQKPRQWQHRWPTREKSVVGVSKEEWSCSLSGREMLQRHSVLSYASLSAGEHPSRRARYVIGVNMLDTRSTILTFKMERTSCSFVPTNASISTKWTSSVETRAWLQVSLQCRLYSNTLSSLKKNWTTMVLCILMSFLSHQL